MMPMKKIRERCGFGGLTPLFSVVAAFCSTAALSAPNVSNVTYWQNPTSKVVEVSYTLEGDSGVPILDICTNGASIGWVNLRGAYGDVHKVIGTGSGKKICWHPDKAWPGHSFDAGVSAVVRVWPTNNPPDIMVVNCEKAYEGRDDAVQYFVSYEHLPEGTVNCDAYKTAKKMAFRKVPAAGIVWRMGSPSLEKGRDSYEALHKVRLTSNYYLGVFEVSQAQYLRFMGHNASYFKTDGAMRPVENVSWYQVRGNDAVWPGATRAEAYASVAGTSFCGKMRTHVGGSLKFDLPTEAQWEFACRAGVGAAFPDGSNLSSGSESSWQFLEAHSRYKNNSGLDATIADNALSTNDATAVIGTYLPNRWGFHDMHGNVLEWTLDCYAAYGTTSEIDDDPSGADGEEKRTTRGGSYLLQPSYERSAKRFGAIPANGSRHIGFRVCVPLD